MGTLPSSLPCPTLTIRGPCTRPACALIHTRVSAAFSEGKSRTLGAARPPRRAQSSPYRGGGSRALRPSALTPRSPPACRLRGGSAAWCRSGFARTSPALAFDCKAAGSHFVQRGRRMLSPCRWPPGLFL